MKKNAFLSFLLTAAMLLQYVLFPVQATELPETTASTEATVETAALDTTVELPFGQNSIVNGCRTIEGRVPLDGMDRKLKTALSVFVYETKTNTVIYAYNPDMKLAPGSLAKLVTALLAVELCEMDEVVTVNSANIARLPAGSQNQDLRNGEQLTVRDLVHCLILQSANDAAIVLAEHISGNLQGFVVLMNERVKRMGCTNTEFANVHGLETATSFTTARDMAKIVAEAEKNEDFAEVFSAIAYEVPATEKSEVRSFRTQNYLMDDKNITKYYDQYVTGGMQSYVSAASGASLVATATPKGTDLDLICVVMGCTREIAANGWQVLSYGNFDEMTDLIDYVARNFKVNRILYDGQALNQFPVAGAESQVVGGPTVNYDTVLKADCQMDNLIREYSVVGGGLSAPVSQGDMIATVSLKYRNCVVAEAELFAMGNAKRMDDSPNIQGQQQQEDGGILGIIGTVCVVILALAAGYLTINALRRSRAQARRRRRRAARRRSN